MGSQTGDIEAWLHRVAAQPLPGGVTAAAVAAAMGAALIAKAARVALRCQDLDATGRVELDTVLNLAQIQGEELMRLARHDEEAYRAVLNTRGLPDRSLERHEAWRIATEIPIQVADACRLLLDRLSGLRGACWLAVRADLEIGSLLLEAGARAGLLVAESNLQTWGSSTEARALCARLIAWDGSRMMNDGG